MEVYVIKGFTRSLYNFHSGENRAQDSDTVTQLP